MDTILYPIMWVIAWIMYGIHQALAAIGLSGGAGAAWVLAIVGLTVVVRVLLLPLYNKQIKASRNMQIIQPEMAKIQKKYKGKRDQISLQRQQEELQALYRKYDASPFASCLPMLVQMPLLFSLYRVLIAFPAIAAGQWGRGASLGPITRKIAGEFENSTVFGAPLSATFANAGANPQYSTMTIRLVAGVLVAIMIFTMFWTQRELMTKNMPENTGEQSPMARQMQKTMLYGFPIMYLFSGVAFPIGVLVYWCASNIWNLGQQTWFIRHNPTPGSKAYKARQERIAAKRRRQGLSEEEISELEAREEQGGQRVQPMSKERAKKAGVELSSVGSDAEPDDDAPARGKDGLTDEERARKRYERRQAERARRKKKNQKRNH